MSYKFENLDYSKPLYALQAFTYNGKTYAPGEPFPWQRLALGKHIVARLWNGRKIRHTLPETLATQLPTDPPPVKTQEAVTPAATQLPTTPPPPQSATIAALEHTGAGWYNIVVDGLGAVNDAKIKGRDAARKWAAENNYSLAVDGE